MNPAYKVWKNREVGKAADDTAAAPTFFKKDTAADDGTTTNDTELSQLASSTENETIISSAPSGGTGRTPVMKTEVIERNCDEKLKKETSVDDKITKLKRSHDDSVLDEDKFDDAKAKAWASHWNPTLISADRKLKKERTPVMKKEWDTYWITEDKKSKR
mmetsp:Transcript_20433/g.21885  ORF Transcript_20433/g.21885 Transcript_20433/m.21885 type:complete len:160 (+) Transcript_20433:2-481(+)